MQAAVDVGVMHSQLLEEHRQELEKQEDGSSAQSSSNMDIRVHTCMYRLWLHSYTQMQHSETLFCLNLYLHTILAFARFIDRDEISPANAGASARK